MFENLNDPQAAWDSESRKSPYSTVADPDDDTYCEFCDQTVVYSGPNDKHGTCGCDEEDSSWPEPDGYRIGDGGTVLSTSR